MLGEGAREGAHRRMAGCVPEFWRQKVHYKSIMGGKTQNVSSVVNLYSVHTTVLTFEEIFYLPIRAHQSPPCPRL